MLAGSANVSNNSLENNWENAFVSDEPLLINEFQRMQTELIKRNTTTKLTEEDFATPFLFTDDDWIDD